MRELFIICVLISVLISLNNWNFSVYKHVSTRKMKIFKSRHIITTLFGIYSYAWNVDIFSKSQLEYINQLY